MLKVGYGIIALLGIDLLSTAHFYTNMFSNSTVSKFDFYDKQENKNRYHGMHATAGRGVHIFLDRLASDNKRTATIVNLSPGSLLRNASNIRTLSLGELQ